MGPKNQFWKFSAFSLESCSRSLEQFFLTVPYVITILVTKNQFLLFFAVILQKRVLKIYSFKQWVMMDSKNTNLEDFCIWMLGEIFQVLKNAKILGWPETGNIHKWCLWHLPLISPHIVNLPPPLRIGDVVYRWSLTALLFLLYVLFERKVNHTTVFY